MLVRVFRSPELLARSLAREVADALNRNPSLVLGLPTGRTPIPLYRELVRLHRAGRADFSRATTFNLDEFAGISAHDPRSYHVFMRQQLFDDVNVPRRRINFLDGAAPDADRECARFERAIARAGRIDLQLLGLGANGHIGFNEPGSGLVARTHRTRLTPQTRRANAALFGRAADVPREALSMGIATILCTRGNESCCSRQAPKRHGASTDDRTGRVTPRVPASFLQLHLRHVDVWIDAAAAALPRRWADQGRSRP